jgi:brefeldin A-inhibited guanine nucleotide-exchange protein
MRVQVDALKQLVTQLLQRSELTVFKWQQDAVAPFVAILRHSDSTPVRELVVQCLQHVLQVCPTSIGSGWDRLLQVRSVSEQ